MARKKNIVIFRPFEGRKAIDTYIRLSKDMLLNKNFLSLSYSAFKLYTYMILWAAGRDEIEYAWSNAKKILKSSSTFDKAKKELIEKGFMKITRTSKCSRQPNMYKFISDWHNK
jgi:hypothetical protein